MQEKKELLTELRSTRVVGRCSQDNSPRVHARNIAILAAETVNWEIFLRAHLDIMNDRFERAIDGSYAWAQRQTYLQELEELDINVPDLILGISLRVSDLSKNHYYGSIGRVGRALAETSYPKEIEKTLLNMMEDENLDDYNRIIAYYLFQNYNYHLTDEKAKAKNEDKLQLAVLNLPAYLSNRILEED